MFGTNEMMWKPFTSWATDILGKTKIIEMQQVCCPCLALACAHSPTIPAECRVRSTSLLLLPPPQDLEHNATNEHLEFNRECVCGIVSYILLDVKDPPPELFLSDPTAYEEQVKHAGVLAALAYLR